MDEQFVAVGVDGRYAGVMPLEVEVRGRHNAVEVLERRERDALGAADGNPPRPLERRALAELARRRSWNFGRIGREGKVARHLGDARLAEGVRADRARDAGEQDSAGKGCVLHGLRSGSGNCRPTVTPLRPP